MKILSVDPGYERLGIAVIEKNKGEEKLIYSSCFRTDKKLSYSDRLVLIGDEISHVIEKFSPKAFASESLFFKKNKKKAI